MSISASRWFPRVFILFKEQNWECEASDTCLNDNALILSHFHVDEDLSNPGSAYSHLCP